MAATDTQSLPAHRPGPFGPAWALLPRGQKLLRLAADTPAKDALERMEQDGFSQAPVVDLHADGGRVIGVFSHRSFARGSLDYQHARKLDPLQQPVSELMDADPVFIDRETYIDTGTDWTERDHVLVGTREHVEGLLTMLDAFGRLNDFAEAFVLIYEVETELRAVIEHVAADDLADWLGSLQRPGAGRPVRGLEDASFADYGTLITSRSRWDAFQPVFARARELIVADLSDVNDIRNVVFHFRRPITVRDTDRLRRFRDKLRRGQRLRRERSPASA